MRKCSQSITARRPTGSKLTTAISILACSACVYMCREKNQKRSRGGVRERFRDKPTSQRKGKTGKKTEAQPKQHCKPRRSEIPSLHQTPAKQRPKSTSDRKPGYRQHLQLCCRVALHASRYAGHDGCKRPHRASMDVTMLQDIGTIREGLPPSNVASLRPMFSYPGQSRLKRAHRRTIHKTLGKTIIDMNITIHRSEIEVVMTGNFVRE